MRRVILTVVATVVGLVLLLSFKSHPLRSAAAISPAAIATLAPSASGSTPSAQPSASASSPQASAPTSTKAPAGGASGTRTIQGDAVDTRYGPVQVAVTLSGKTIKDITIVEVPSDRQRDVEINDYAVPILRQEALAAQNAQINMVSGATYTSQGYMQSLQSALDKA